MRQGDNFEHAIEQRMATGEPFTHRELCALDEKACAMHRHAERAIARWVSRRWITKVPTARRGNTWKWEWHLTLKGRAALKSLGVYHVETSGADEDR